jgi:hypothetical protein
LHTWDAGATWSTGGFLGPDLEWIFGLCGDYERPRIIETGAGCSTITFLLCEPKFVRSVAPDARLRDRILAYSKKMGISTKPLRYTVGLSQATLPRWARKFTCDIALIDGSHGWPLPFVDLCYIDMMLAKGGLLFIDDLQIYGVGETARFLTRQPGWEAVGGAPNRRTLALRKLTDARGFGEWNEQPYLLDKTVGQRFGFGNYGLSADLGLFHPDSLTGEQVS